VENPLGGHSTYEEAIKGLFSIPVWRDGKWVNRPAQVVKTRGIGGKNCYSLRDRLFFLTRYQRDHGQPELSATDVCVNAQKAINAIVGSLPVYSPDSPLRGVVFNSTVYANPDDSDLGWGLMSDSQRSQGRTFNGKINTQDGVVEIPDIHTSLRPFGSIGTTRRPISQMLDPRATNSGCRPLVITQAFNDLTRCCGGVPENYLNLIVGFIDVPENYEDQLACGEIVFVPDTYKTRTIHVPAMMDFHVGQELARDQIYQTPAGKTIRADSICVTGVEEIEIVRKEQVVIVKRITLLCTYHGLPGRKLTCWGQKGVAGYFPEAQYQVRFRDKISGKQIECSTDVVMSIKSVGSRQTYNLLPHARLQMLAYLRETEYILTPENEKEMLRDACESLEASIFIQGEWRDSVVSRDENGEFTLHGPHVGCLPFAIVREPHDARG